ncbi:hypothetical protein QQ020_07405 [Fulvivirgaceae bacterium BMA12]|uniref:Uncharacterized protein n=1 Tax=Agaribacillus aureus TaxID=3051825 RepID=A0ABT8L4C0_9BACT|nr:hypothetical protein [Fulvivirgaceae bacterium BMA12]
MNKIEAVWDKSNSKNHQDLLNIQVDGHFLNKNLEVIYQDKMYHDLVPTLLFNLEKDIVWSRILPFEHQVTICPILMSSGESDPSYTLIVAEIENLVHSIRWNRLGVDKATGQDPELAGSTIDWLDKVAPMAFEIDEYMTMIKIFAKYIADNARK